MTPSVLQVRGFSDRPRDERVPRVRLVASGPARHAKALVRISLLDGMSLHVDGREVRLNSRKAKALIAYLLLTPHMTETRDRLVGLLWSETEDAKARASLRQLLHSLRDAFDQEGLVGLSTDKTHVSLDGSVFETDLGCALASIDRGDPADTLVTEACITDSFLRGYDDIDPSFGSWLAIKRESVRQLLIQRLEAQFSNASHRVEATKRIARALIQMDPTHEIACQELMRACVASGNTAAALTAYRRLWECLEREHDIEPSMATQEIVVAIKNGNYSPRITGCDLHGSNTVVFLPK
jgi:DNA-binding SARP family transcriptional activator